MKVLSLDHIHIYCQDIESSAAFYIEHFEAEEVIRNENAHAQTRIFLSCGGSVIVCSPFPPEISPAVPPEPGDGAISNGYGVAHFGLRVPNVESAVEELKTKGIEFLAPPVSEQTGLIYAYLKAPDGVIVELTQYGSKYS